MCLADISPAAVRLGACLYYVHCDDDKAYIHCVPEKKIPDTIDCDLKKDDRILIVFGKNIPGQLATKRLFKVPTSPSVCFCLGKSEQTKGSAEAHIG